MDRLLDDVRAGDSRVLVLRGEAGVGKTALLDYVQERVPDCRVVRAAGIESEMELAFAVLHQLCAPLLNGLERLPDPQSEALSTAFGLGAGAAPDRYTVSLAVLGLLSEAAAERPLVCLIDDAQWLDRASAQALAFVARRLLAESVAILFSLTWVTSIGHWPNSSRRASAAAPSKKRRPPSGSSRNEPGPAVRTGLSASWPGRRRC